MVILNFRETIFYFPSEINQVVILFYGHTLFCEYAFKKYLETQYNSITHLDPKSYGFIKKTCRIPFFGMAEKKVHGHLLHNGGFSSQFTIFQKGYGEKGGSQETPDSPISLTNC